MLLLMYYNRNCWIMRYVFLYFYLSAQCFLILEININVILHFSYFCFPNHILTLYTQNTVRIFTNFVPILICANSSLLYEF